MLGPTDQLWNRKWTALASHRAWLLGQAEKLFSFFERQINPLEGFYDLDDGGRPTARPVTVKVRSPLGISFGTVLTFTFIMLYVYM
jgi:hypothetical protein